MLKTMRIEIDENDKKDFELICESLGVTPSIVTNNNLFFFMSIILLNSKDYN